MEGRKWVRLYILYEAVQLQTELSIEPDSQFMVEENAWVQYHMSSKL